MGEKTSIAWCDHTFNPWWGCSRVSPGCDHCYAEAFDKRVYPLEILPATQHQRAVTIASHWGNGRPRRTFGEKHWQEPLKWNAAAMKAGVLRRVFCASMADIFDLFGPAEERKRLWWLIGQTPFLIWQILTKRPEHFPLMLPRSFPSRNVWIGVTAEDQAHYDIRVPLLRDAAVRTGCITWVSYEPALGPLELQLYPGAWVPDWVIFGGESGPGRRPCDPKWARDLREQIRSRHLCTKVFVKQMGGRTPAEGTAAIPADLFVREFPA